MDHTFDAPDFIARTGKRLVDQFDDAGTATSPSTVGAARERAVKTQLEQILPRGIAVGSGFVIDSDGGTSRQMDVVLYERDICPVFSVNATPESTYYPCEGVVAVGEIKSSLTTPTLNDAMCKIASVKSLRRHRVAPSPTELAYLPNVQDKVHSRHYGDIEDPSLLNVYDRSSVESDDYYEIYAFILAGTLKVSVETLLRKFAQLSAKFGDARSPNQVSVLNRGVLLPVCNAERQYAFSPRSATHFLYLEGQHAFESLIQRVYWAYRRQLTSPIESFARYLFKRLPSVTYSGPVLPKMANKTTDL